MRLAIRRNRVPLVRLLGWGIFDHATSRAAAIRSVVSCSIITVVRRCGDGAAAFSFLQRNRPPVGRLKRASAW